jgi:hypothetical protein
MTVTVTGTLGVAPPPSPLVFNAVDYGALGNGVHDDTTNIQNAINAAAAAGSSTLGNGKGGIVFFPPGAYKTTAALTNNVSGSTVRLVGSGANISGIYGAVSGFIVSQSNAAGSGQIISVEYLTISNTTTSSGFDLTVGGILLNNVQNGLIAGCSIFGWTCIAAYSNTFETTIINCNCAAVGSWTTSGGPIGIYFSGGGIIDTAVVSAYAGFMIASTPSSGNGASDTAMYRTRSEACNIGVVLGRDTAGTVCTAEPFFMNSHSTERCNTAIDIASITAGVLSGVILTGTIGVANFINSGNITWAAGGGGTATLTQTGGTTLNNLGWTSGTRLVKIEGVTPSGYNTAGFVTGTYISSTSFSYPLVANPGAYVSGGDWGFEIQYGVRISNANNLVINGLTVSITPCQVAGVDLNYGANSSGANNTLTSVTAGVGGWALPAAPSKASFQYIQCDQPGGSTNDALGNVAGMVFANLPGQAGVAATPATEGQEYDIINQNNSAVTFGATGAGGGTTHARVRWKGSNWTVMGI